jgi:hypothetical protein
MEMICKEDKFQVICRYLLRWSQMLHIPLSEIRSAVGLMLWLSEAFSIGKADVAPMVGLNANGW